jgi:hypothetical protein
MHRGAVCLGTSRVTVLYPSALQACFDRLVTAEQAGADKNNWVVLDEDVTPGTFRLGDSTGPDVQGALTLGDALAAFWDRVTALLMAGLDDALGLRAAALRRGKSLVLLPGATGAGKTRLALWLHARGFQIATDAAVAAAEAKAGGGIAATTLARPLLVDDTIEAGALLLQGVGKVQPTSHGTLAWTENLAMRPPEPVEQGLIIFPRFMPDAPLALKPIPAAQIGLRLSQHSLNAARLPRGGTAFAAAIARHLAAVSLDYGKTEQLNGTLDVLIRQVLAAPPGADDLDALCSAFSARASQRAPARPVPAPREVPPPTAERFARRLTVGMATYDDYDGVFFTIQSIRLHNPELADALEFVVIDNNPGGPCSKALKRLEGSVGGYRYAPRGELSGTAIRNAIFEEAASELVLCLDSHVLIVPGALSRLIDVLESPEHRLDLLQGPLLYDDLRRMATHFRPGWDGGMYGIWDCDARGTHPDAPAFDIPMQGLGLFACRGDAWPGFNPRFRGFGGEEGYLHEKFRRRGGRTLCLPFLRWLHRFERPLGTPYAIRWEDRMRNYWIGFRELGWDTAEMEQHFRGLLGAERASRILAEIETEVVEAAA